MNRRIKLLTSCILGLVLLSISGCVSLKTEEELSIQETTQQKTYKPVSKKTARQGIYHKVKKGETLWRISKAYNVSLNEITSTNKIPKAAKIEKGQLVFIPGAVSAKTIVLESTEDQKAFTWPLKGKILKYFHERYGGQVSKGIDIKARVGDEVLASRTGTVVFADYLAGYGETVILDHQDGYYSVYAKNSKLLVRLNDYVMKRNAIAKVGHNRNLAYLHFQIRKRSVEDNPLYYLP